MVGRAGALTQNKNNQPAQNSPTGWGQNPHSAQKATLYAQLPTLQFSSTGVRNLFLLPAVVSCVALVCATGSGHLVLTACALIMWAVLEAVRSFYLEAGFFIKKRLARFSPFRALLLGPVDKPDFLARDKKTWPTGKLCDAEMDSPGAST